MKFLDALRPLMLMIPEVAQPDRPVPFREKATWTFVTLLIFLVCSQLPLYGVPAAAVSADPFYRLRVMLASSRATLMELGVFPILMSGLLMQLLAGARLFEVNMSLKEDRALFSGAQKLFGVVITVLAAVFYVLSGLYGNVADLGITTAALIIAQLVCAGIIVIILDELLQKGYGLGSGVSLFIACNVCQSFVAGAVSPLTVDTGKGPEFQGALIAFFHLLYVRPNKFQALYEGLFRTNLPSIWSLLATAVVFLITVYFQGWKIDVPVYSPKARGGHVNYPIKLFYTSNMPVILQASLVSSIYFLSQLLFARHSGNFLVKLLGVWKEVDGKLIPTEGLSYYVSPPHSIVQMFTDPFHTLFYILFVLSACAIFSQAWVEISGSSATSVARSLRDQQLGMRGHRDTGMNSVLNRYIPIAAASGGMLIGAITVLADFLGAVGSGTGLLLAVTIIYQYYEIFAREAAAAGMLPGMGMGM